MNVLYYEVHVTFEGLAPHMLRPPMFGFWTSVVDKEPDEVGPARLVIATRRFADYGDAEGMMQALSRAIEKHGGRVTRRKIEATVYDTKGVRP